MHIRAQCNRTGRLQYPGTGVSTNSMCICERLAREAMGQSSSQDAVHSKAMYGICPVGSRSPLGRGLVDHHGIAGGAAGGAKGARGQPQKLHPRRRREEDEGRGGRRPWRSRILCASCRLSESRFDASRGLRAPSTVPSVGPGPALVRGAIGVVPLPLRLSASPLPGAPPEESLRRPSAPL